MNSITIIGNLANDPEYMISANGTQLCKFSVAVNRRFKRDNEPEADFFRVTTFKNTAENCAKYLSRGKKVAVSGEMHFGQYTDKEGIKRLSADLIANEVEFLTPKVESEEPVQSAPRKVSTVLEPVTDDSLPF